MAYLKERLKAENEGIAYRYYISDSLFYIGQNMHLTKKYRDIIHPPKEDTRTGDEIAMDVITRAGLKVI